jgi:hypothetical protein
MAEVWAAPKNSTWRLQPARYNCKHEALAGLGNRDSPFMNHTPDEAQPFTFEKCVAARSDTRALIRFPL